MDYFYREQSEQFDNIFVPKALVFDKDFSHLSDTAKMLYGILLQKMGEVKNKGWFDEMNRAFLEYTLTEMSEDIGCSRHKIINCVNELEGIGLIVIDRSQKGRANRIYVKNFARRQKLTVMD